MTRDRSLISRYGLETALAVSVVTLVLQLAWPTIDDWWNRPVAGRMGTLRVAKEKGIPGLAHRYLVYLPENFDSSAGPWPLLLYLHGAGERGWKAEDAKRYGVPQRLGVDFHLPAIVVTPVCLPHQAWDPKALVALIDEIESMYQVDRSREYVMGHSMGGFGAWDLARSAPDRIAAIVILGGGGHVAESDDVADVAVWAIHGEDDTVVLPDQGLELIAALKAKGVRAIHTLVPNEGHGTHKYPLSHPELFEWLFAQRKPKGSDR